METAELRRRFASSPVARLSTVRPDGAPHVVPIVFAARRRHRVLGGRRQAEALEGPAAARERAGRASLRSPRGPLRGRLAPLVVGARRRHRRGRRGPARRPPRNPGARAAVSAVPRRASVRTAPRGHRPPVDRLDEHVLTRGDRGGHRHRHPEQRPGHHRPPAAGVGPAGGGRGLLHPRHDRPGRLPELRGADGPRGRRRGDRTHRAHDEHPGRTDPQRGRAGQAGGHGARDQRGAAHAGRGRRWAGGRLRAHGAGLRLARAPVRRAARRAATGLRRRATGRRERTGGARTGRSPCRS